jgi:hypothetical protein
MGSIGKFPKWFKHYEISSFARLGTVSFERVSG